MLKLFVLLGLFLLIVNFANADITIAVNSPSVRFSPATWAGDAGRGGALYRKTWNNGAWCEWRWTTNSVHPQAILQISNPTLGSAVSYFLDGTLIDNVPVPASGGIMIGGLTQPGQHTLTVYTRHSRQEARWNGTNAYTVTGLTLDDGASPLPVPRRRPWVLVIGDSITEGIAASNGADSNLCDYSFLLGQGLRAAGYDSAVSACGYSGWLRPGDAQGDVPAYSPPHGEGRWNKIDAQTSLLDLHGRLSADGGTGQEPAAILFNYGVNECLSGTDKAALRLSITHALATVRQAAPQTQLLVLVPPGLADTRLYPNGLAYITALKLGFADFQASHPKDRRAVLLDLGPEVAHALVSPLYGGGVHPNAAGHAYLAPLILQTVLRRLP